MTEIARSERIFVDTSRATPATATFAGAPERTLRTLIWRAQGGGPRPLLLMAHGFGGLPEKFDAFAGAIAAAGYVVAAPAFPLTNENAPGGHETGFSDFINQPADLSFVLTQLLAAATTSGDGLENRIEIADVAVLGHSLGGVTALAFTRKACCTDERVRASVLVAAVAGLASAFGSDPLALGHPPALILHGRADQTVPVSVSEMLYETILAPRFFVGIDGGGHSDALESQDEPPITARDAAQHAVIAFLNAEFHDRADALDHTLDELEAEGHVVERDDS